MILGKPIVETDRGRPISHDVGNSQLRRLGDCVLYIGDGAFKKRNLFVRRQATVNKNEIL
jgi:hypothetical protein